MTDLATQSPNGTLSLIEQALIVGDLSKLSSPDRANYYAKVCESVGLNPLTRPFDYLTLNGKLILYARKDATDQLRSLRGVTIAITPSQVGDLYVVTARATLPDGRSDEEIGAVSIAGLRGDALANAMMKATTKAKRRVTLSICGLGMLDESEVETIPEAHRQQVDARPLARKAPEIAESRPTPTEGTPEPAEGEYTADGPYSASEAEEGDPALAVTEEAESPALGAARSLYSRMQRFTVFERVKFPEATDDKTLSAWHDGWLGKVEDAERAAERRARQASGPGR